jgi:hypothetical protein
MSAFGGEADIAIPGDTCLLLRTLLGVERTLLFAPLMSASDPKRTLPNGLEAQGIRFATCFAQKSNEQTIDLNQIALA